MALVSNGVPSPQLIFAPNSVGVSVTLGTVKLGTSRLLTKSSGGTSTLFTTNDLDERFAAQRAAGHALDRDRHGVGVVGLVEAVYPVGVPALDREAAVATRYRRRGVQWRAVAPVHGCCELSRGHGQIAGGETGH